MHNRASVLPRNRSASICTAVMGTLAHFTLNSCVSMCRSLLKLERPASGLLCHLLLLFTSLVTVIAKLLQVSTHKILFLKNSAANCGDCTLFLFIKIKHTFKCWSSCSIKKSTHFKNLLCKILSAVFAVMPWKFPSHRQLTHQMADLMH